MAVCDNCGNDYENAMVITVEGRPGQAVYDSFECAIAGQAPRCGHCATPVIGHGVGYGGAVYCCANCARLAGAGESAGHTAHADAHGEGVSP